MIFALASSMPPTTATDCTLSSKTASNMAGIPPSSAAGGADSSTISAWSARPAVTESKGWKPYLCENAWIPAAWLLVWTSYTKSVPSVFMPSSPICWTSANATADADSRQTDKNFFILTSCSILKTESAARAAGRVSMTVPAAGGIANRLRRCLQLAIT